MNKIFNDFLMDLDNKEDYCELRDFRSDGNNILDYSNPIMRKLYLLRYMPAHMAEYYFMYESMFRYKFLDNNPNILSIGAGCGVDLWGAKFAGDQYSPGSDIRYTGLDNVNWNYHDNLGIEEYYFIFQDVNEFRKLDESDYNVIIFPKSIGELNASTFNDLKNCIRNTTFKNDKIVLLSSIRNARDNFDMKRLGEIADIFADKHGYSCLDDKDVYYHFDTDRNGKYPRLETVCSGFAYPEDIKNYMINLNSHCGVFIDNGCEPCDESCRKMNRWPVLTASQIKYQVLRLQRLV